MKVSVIVPAFNAEATLEAAVNSLLATGYPDLEILVVEDGSKDATMALAQGLASFYPGVVYVVTHAGCAHRGVSASRNLGIRQSTGELIAFLDADDLVLPNRFKASVDMLRERSDVEGVYELTRILNRSQQSEAVERQWSDGSIFGIDEALVGSDLLRKLMTGIPWHGNAFLCRRVLFEIVGLFDETRIMAEDCHLWIRAAASATILPADPLDVVSLYIRHGSNSYNYSLERRLDLLDAMADAGIWIKHHAAEQQKHWRLGFKDYFVRSLLAAQDSLSCRMQLSLIALCCRYRLFGTIFDKFVMRQLWRGFRRHLRSVSQFPL